MLHHRSFLACTAALLACGGGGKSGATSLCSQYQITYTDGSTSHTLTSGLTEASGVPHGNANVGATGALQLFASTEECTLGEFNTPGACTETVVIGTSPGMDAVYGGELDVGDFWDFPLREIVMVTVTAMDDEAIQGTFRAETMTGEFCVARDDQLVLD